MLSGCTPGVLLVPGPAATPVLEPAIGPVSTISYPCTDPRDTRVETSWVSWVLASKSLPLAAESRRCASAVARLASATDESVLLRTRPSVICWSSTHPTSETTTADSSRVLMTTRAWMERRQIVPTERSPDPRAARRSSSRGAGRGLARVNIGLLRVPGLVADAADRHHDLGVLRVVLDLRPQPLDVHVDQPRVGGVPVAPHLLEEHLAGEHLPGLAGQAHEQVELERRQRDRLAATGHHVAGDVDRQVADRERLRGRVLEAAHPRPDPGHQLLRLERLDDVVVGPGLE